MWTLPALMSTETIFMHLLISLILSLALWLEREFKFQPAWIRTHVLIWLGSTLLMIISIMIPDMYSSTVKDHSRIAAQVVSGIWFLWAWAIIKMWMTTKGLTTAANIWVTAAIWLTVWAWLYEVAIIATWLILLSLIVFTNLKNKFIKKFSYWKLRLDFDKKKMSSAKIIESLMNLPISGISKNIKENE